MLIVSVWTTTVIGSHLEQIRLAIVRWEIPQELFSGFAEAVNIVFMQIGMLAGILKPVHTPIVVKVFPLQRLIQV